MATYTLSPYTKKQYFDNSGHPLAAGRIYTYAAGTTTALTTYKTSSGTSWGPYVQLDSAGRPENGEIYLQPGQSYKYIAKNSSGVEQWTQDNIGAVPPSSVNVDITGTAGEALTAGQIAYVGANGAWFRADADAAATATAPTMGFVVSSLSTGETGTFRTDGQIELAGPLTAEALYYVSTTAGDITATAPAFARMVGQAQSTTLLVIALNPPALIAPERPKGRLTLTSGTPVTTSDVTAATTLYFSPYGGNTLTLFDGTRWGRATFSQLSIAVPATTNQMYDVFVYNNAGTLTLELTAWTNDTTRATALTTQNGVYVKTGALTRLFLGSFRTTGVSGQTEDSYANRLVGNYYNRVARPLWKGNTGNYNYTLATWREANGGSNSVTFITAVAEDAVRLKATAVATNGTSNVNFGAAIGLDTTTAPTANQGNATSGVGAASTFTFFSWLETVPAVGYHFAARLEFSDPAGTTTWYDSAKITGQQAGIGGTVMA